VKVTTCDEVPDIGIVVIDRNAKVPDTLATPPDRLASLRDCPLFIFDAVGQVVIVGVALETATVTFELPDDVTVV
jgi:hypothetical protein